MCVKGVEDWPCGQSSAFLFIRAVGIEHGSIRSGTKFHPYWNQVPFLLELDSPILGTYNITTVAM